MRRLFPTINLENFDPFVLLDEFFVEKGAGFPSHEHRGFEAITYMLEGSFKHKDNIGNDSEVFANGVQRFTAGKGIIHSEMPGKSKINHGFQLWINLPRKLKNAAPSYQQIDKCPQIKENDVEIRTIAGKGTEIKLNTQILFQDILIEKDKEYWIRLPKDFNGFIYVYDGELKGVKKGEALIIEKEYEVMSKEKSRFIIVAGKPIDEPIYQRGPFVD